MAMLPNYRLAIKEISGMVLGDATEYSKGTKPRTDYHSMMLYLGNPQEYPCQYIHVAGTNGKGTVCLKLAKMLQSSGFKTGLYTSPHLFSFTQRIAINGRNITQQKFSQVFGDINYLMKRYDLKVTFFEFLTAMGFLHFSNEKCDVVVLETGLGGRFDSTNIINPLLSVITSIGHDHTETLGRTLEEIAYQKAGIIKPKVPVLLGPECQPVDVFYQEAQKLKSPVFKIDQLKNDDFTCNSDKIVEESARLLKQFYKKVFVNKITDQSVQSSKSVTQRCRMQAIEKAEFPKKFADSKVKRIIFDVGHNPEALGHLVKALRKKYTGEKFLFVYGTSSKKDCQTSLKILTEAAEKIYLIQADHIRAMPIKTIKDLSTEIKTEIIHDGVIQPTIEEILRTQEVENVVVCGSFFIMEEALGCFDDRYLEMSEKLPPEVTTPKQ